MVEQFLSKEQLESQPQIPIRYRSCKVLTVIDQTVVALISTYNMQGAISQRQRVLLHKHTVCNIDEVMTTM